MAALGNSADGPTQNPSVLRQKNQGQLQNVTIIGRSFHFDDENDPTMATVKFEIDEGAETRDLHLVSYSLPGPYDESEVDQQEQYDVENGTFEGGETGEMTVMIPQKSTTAQNTTLVPPNIHLLGFGAAGVALVLSRRKRTS